jgi:hypothetical protein
MATRKRAKQAEGSVVRVRMYRQGLGDCFLIALPGAGGRTYHVMIDCGVILGTPDAEAKMRAVVEDIILETSGTVDLLISTHEHWDHLSGFIQVQDLFADGDGGSTAGKLQIEKLWFAWTEDPKDELAKLLRLERQRKKEGLRLAVERMRAAEADAGLVSANSSRPFLPSEQVESLLEFFGAAGGASTSSALQAVRRYSRSEPRYCRPADAPVTMPQVPGVRFFVLGPPQDEKLIKRSDPSKAHPEVYDLAMALTPENTFFAAVARGMGAAGGDGWTELSELACPFDASHRIPEDLARETPWFQKHYLGEAEGESLIDQSWRRIDSEWMESAAQFALQLDSDTNNTSLALAVELVESGRVLLFPADAQVGNWLSWKDLRWTVRNAAGERVDVTGPDLLARTVLYKVGHHGSHNATLREFGLELMTSDELVAMVPVDRSMALKKRWTRMPFEPLMKRLAEKTSGRILRVDDSEPLDRRIWKRFLDNVRENDLYYEYRIESGAVG